MKCLNCELFGSLVLGTKPETQTEQDSQSSAVLAGFLPNIAGGDWEQNMLNEESLWLTERNKKHDFVSSSWPEELIVEKTFLWEQVTAYWDRENSSHPLGMSNDKLEEVVQLSTAHALAQRFSQGRLHGSLFFLHFSL